MVELIVVVVIIAILWTIAFISIVNYPKQARDSKRISDLRLMEKSLSLYELLVWSYPMPEEIKTISSISWAIEWTFWNDNFLQVWKLDQLPKDPLSDKTYTYFVSDNWKSFRIETKLEDGSIFSVWNLNPDNLLGTSLTWSISSDCIPTDDSYFAFYETTWTITGYSHEWPKDVCIPDNINWVSVTSIWNTAFHSNLLTSVIIPNSVTSIWSYAFHVNLINSLKISNSLTSIWTYTFALNHLTNIDIPDSVTSIWFASFRQNNLASVVIPNSVTNIWEASFKENQLTNISLPNSLTYIWDTSFERNNLTNVVIPNSVTSIWTASFNGNSLPDEQAFIYARKPDWSNDMTNLASYWWAKRENVIIPSSVIYIWSYALHDLYLRSVIIPNSVSYIWYFAFINNSLTSVHIPNSNAKCDDWRDWTDWSECFDSEVEINHNQ